MLHAISWCFNRLHWLHPKATWQNWLFNWFFVKSYWDNLPDVPIGSIVAQTRRVNPVNLQADLVQSLGFVYRTLRNEQIVLLLGLETKLRKCYCRSASNAVQISGWEQGQCTYAAAIQRNPHSEGRDEFTLSKNSLWLSRFLNRV